MTIIGIERFEYQLPGRGWLWGPHGTEPGTNPSIALDLTNGGFVPATHYPKGYVESGLVLGKITASGKYGVYDPAAADGRNKAVGLLFDAFTVPRDLTQVVGNALFVHGFVDPNRLPYKTGTGSADTAAKTALSLIYWA